MGASYKTPFSMHTHHPEPLGSTTAHLGRFFSATGRFTLLLLFLLLLAPVAIAELKLPSIIGDHMVLQQNQRNLLWGWDAPGTIVTVTFSGQTIIAQAGSDGKWSANLNSIPASDKPQTLTINGTEKKEIQDVLVGEVWMCSGQSNMGFTLAGDWNGDIEAAASKLPNLRLIKVPPVGTQELQSDFKGQWRASTPEAARNFSAVGVRQIRKILGDITQLAGGHGPAILRQPGGNCVQIRPGRHKARAAPVRRNVVVLLAGERSDILRSGLDGGSLDVHAGVGVMGLDQPDVIK